MPLVKRIVSGGQTGVDSAALSFALKHGIAHGGWCPRGRKREGGVIPARYHLHETPEAAYAQRTLWNVRDSDGTIIFSLSSRLTGGTKKTALFARQLRKPWLHLSAHDREVDHAAVLRRFIRKHRIRVLNVAGPRKSQEPGVGRFVGRVLRKAFCRRNWRAEKADV